MAQEHTKETWIEFRALGVGLAQTHALLNLPIPIQIHNLFMGSNDLPFREILGWKLHAVRHTQYSQAAPTRGRSNEEAPKFSLCKEKLLWSLT